MDFVELILQVLIFPGLLFAAVIGLATSWIDRFVTARVQMRVGPPLLQPFYDVIKLMIKETCVPSGGSKMLFLSAPLIGLAGASLASLILWRAILFPVKGFSGDLIVVLYLLTMPALSIVLGAFASRNPLASLGGSREMKLIMAYELPFILVSFIPVIKSHGISLALLMANPIVATVPGVIALIVAILCTQAKLGFVPFDASEAETELTGGVLVEYSGPPLAMFKLTRAIMLFTMPVFVVTVFCGGIRFDGGWAPALLGILKYVGVVVAVVLIKNTAPRVRIDHSVRFFWGPVTIAALVAAMLAFLIW